MSKYEEFAQEYEKLAAEGKETYSPEIQALAYRIEAFRWRMSEHRDAVSDQCGAAELADRQSAIEHRELYLKTLDRNTAALESIAESLAKLTAEKR